MPTGLQGRRRGLLGKHFDRGGVLELLAVAPTPAALREFGPEQMAEVMRPRSPRPAKSLPAKILAALDAQTVVVPGTTDFGRVIAGVAAQLRDIHTERAALASDLEARLEARPLAAVLTGEVKSVGPAGVIKNRHTAADLQPRPLDRHASDS